MSKFTEWLEEQIEQRGLGYNQLASYTGLSSSGISKLRLGQRRPSPETLRKLADYFKVDYDWLLAQAGYREEETLEEDWQRVIDPEMRVWLNVDNINNLSEPGRVAIIAVIKAEQAVRAREKEQHRRVAEARKRVQGSKGDGQGK